MSSVYPSINLDSDNLDTDEKMQTMDNEMHADTSSSPANSSSRNSSSSGTVQMDEGDDCEAENEADEEVSEEETFDELIQRIIQEEKYEEALELIIANEREIEDDEAEEAFKIRILHLVQKINGPEFYRLTYENGNNIIQMILSHKSIYNETKQVLIEAIREQLEAKLFLELLNFRNQNDESALLVVIKNKRDDQFQVLEYLVKNGANLDETPKDSKNYPLMYATTSENYALTKKLLALGASPRIYSDYGRTPLMLVTNYRTNIKLMQLFLKYKLTLNDRDEKGETVLLRAIRENDQGLARFLIEIGADITIKNAAGLTPHALAIATGLKNNPKLMQLLESKTQTVDKKETFLTDSKDQIETSFNAFNNMNDQLFQAVVKGDMVEVKYLIYLKKLLLKVKLFNEQFNNNDDVVCAIKNQKLEILEYLLSNRKGLYYCQNCKANLSCNDLENCQRKHLNSVNKQGELPLTCAIELENALPFVKVLVENGALELAYTSAGETPLDLASRLIKKDVVAYLHKTLRNKARVSLKIIPPGPLDLDCFVEEYEGQLIPAAKGYCLIAHHKALKDNGPKFFIAINKAALLQVLNLFNKAKEGTELTLIFKFLETEIYSSDHTVTIKVEKLNGNNHIIFMDSVIRDQGDSLDDNSSEEEIVDYHTKFLDILENELDNFGTDTETHFYLATTRTQTNDVSCGVYSIKNASKAARSPKLSEELQNGKHITKSSVRKSGIIVHKFVLPPRFAQITRSPTELTRLIAFYAGRKDLVANECIGLQSYALKPRKLGQKEFLPITVPNVHFVSDEETPGVARFAQKPITIVYNLEKIIQKILPEMLEKYTREELGIILQHYDAANLQLTSDNELVPSYDLKIKGEAGFTPSQNLFRPSQDLFTPRQDLKARGEEARGKEARGDAHFTSGFDQKTKKEEGFDLLEDGDVTMSDQGELNLGDTKGEKDCQSVSKTNTTHVAFTAHAALKPQVLGNSGKANLTTNSSNSNSSTSNSDHSNLNSKSNKRKERSETDNKENTVNKENISPDATPRIKRIKT